LAEELNIRIKANDFKDESHITSICSVKLNIPLENISGFLITKKSIDARGREIFFNLNLKVYVKPEIPEAHQKIPPFEQLNSKIQKKK